MKALRVTACGLLVMVGCGKPAAGLDARMSRPADDAQIDGAPGDGAPRDSAPVDSAPRDSAPVDGAPRDGAPVGNPALGAHAMRFYHLDESNASSITTAMATQPTGSTIVVGVGRGDNTLFALPTDNKGNVPYQQLGPMRPYNHPFTGSGTALYAFTGANGGSDFAVSTTTGQIGTGQFDEITMAAVEVIAGSQVQFTWNAVNGPPHTTNSITTTGPATLIAFWWGSGFPGGVPQSAIPNNGFTPIETNTQELHSYIQCAVAARNVAAAGTYNVTWTATPEQGAQLWLIAVE